MAERELYFKRCRLCACESIVILNLYCDEARRKDIITKIRTYLLLQVSPCDGLPEVICYQCLCKIEQFHVFKLKCEEAEHTLRNWTFFFEGKNPEMANDIEIIDERRRSYYSTLASPPTVSDVGHVNKALKQDDTLIRSHNQNQINAFENQIEEVDSDAFCMEDSFDPQTSTPKEKQRIAQNCDRIVNDMLPTDVVPKTSCKSPNNVHASRKSQEVSEAQKVNNIITKTPEKDIQELHLNNGDFKCGSSLHKKHNESFQTKAMVHTNELCNPNSNSLASTPKVQRLRQCRRDKKVDKEMEQDIIEFDHSETSQIIVASRIKRNKKSPVVYNRSKNRKKIVKDTYQDLNGNSEEEKIESNRSPFYSSDEAVLENTENVNSESSDCIDMLVDNENQNLGTPNSKEVKPNLQTIEPVMTPTGKRVWNCSICNNKYSSKFYVKEHMRIHTGERPFVCETCDRPFRNKFMLRSHMDFHLNSPKRDYICTICSKKFKQRYHLQSHMFVHSKDRTFDCNECGLVFKQETGLQWHLRCHNNETP